MPLFRGRKRGQNAVEFLMTYAWAILVVAVVIVVLGYLGLPALSNNEPERCSFPAGSLVCNRLAMVKTTDAGGYVEIDELNITNNFNKAMHICTIGCSAGQAGPKGWPDYFSPLVTDACGENSNVVEPGQSKKIIGGGSPAAHCRDETGTTLAYPAVGALYRGKIYVLYSYADETAGDARVIVADAVSRVQRGG